MHVVLLGITVSVKLPLVLTIVSVGVPSFEPLIYIISAV